MGYRENHQCPNAPRRDATTIPSHPHIHLFNPIFHIYSGLAFRGFQLDSTLRDATFQCFVEPSQFTFCTTSVIFWVSFRLSMSRLISSLTGQTFRDVSCGMRCYSRRAALQLYPLARFTYTQEVFLNLVSRQLRIVEVPIRVRGEREFGQSRVADSLWRYALRTALIIVRAYRDYWPLHFFGAIALGLLGLAAGLGGFFLIHYARTGQFRPHTWAVAGAGAALGLAALMMHMALIGDMLSRHRIYLEELLSRQREGPRDPRTPPEGPAAGTIPPSHQ
jgi:hypothetical protein